MSDLLQVYALKVQQGQIQKDSRQQSIIAHFERIRVALTKKFRFWSLRKAKKIQGLYLFGTVGAGKTFLMDLFFEHLAIKEKKRYHFHQFMQEVDAFLRAHQGDKDPLYLFVKKFARTTRVLCFDEFLVYDIAHAMILANLLEALFKAGVVLVATSNIPPELLYEDGLQRARFLPAIAEIESHCEVVSLVLRRDYRQASNEYYPAYFFEAESDKMFDEFKALSGPIVIGGAIKIQGREIPFKYRSLASIWFDFDVLCNIPRSQLDYLELASQFDVLFVSGLDVLTLEKKAAALLLIHLVDVAYDAHLRLVISAHVSRENIFSSDLGLPGIARTLSRLEEMQTKAYQTQSML